MSDLPRKKMRDIREIVMAVAQTKSEARSLAKALKEGMTQTFDEIHAGPINPEYFYPLGSNAECSSQHSKKLYKLTRQLTHIKNHLETHPDNQTYSKLLLDSVEEVIGLITSYREETRELPFDWIKQRFLYEEHRGRKLIYPPGNHSQLMAIRPQLVCHESDDECDSVEGSLKDPNFSRLGRLDLVVSKPLVDHDMFTNFLDGHDKQIWQEFKELNEGFHEGEEKRSIEVDSPIVSVVGNFAVAAFNDACKKHAKKGQPNNLHGFEFMECKFKKGSGAYHFYMILKAIEEGKRGTYTAEVVFRTCDDASALCKFVSTNYKPIGTKALAVSYLSCLESICKTFEDLSKEKDKRLTDIFMGVGVPEVYTAEGEMHQHRKIAALTKNGLRSRLEEDKKRHLQSYSIQTTNSGPKQATTSKGKTKLWRC